MEPNSRYCRYGDDTNSEGEEARPAVESVDHLNVTAIRPIIGDYVWFRLTTSYASS